MKTEQEIIAEVEQRTGSLDWGETKEQEVSSLTLCGQSGGRRKVVSRSARLTKEQRTSLLQDRAFTRSNYKQVQVFAHPWRVEISASADTESVV